MPDSSLNDNVCVLKHPQLSSLLKHRTASVTICRLLLLACGNIIYNALIRIFSNCFPKSKIIKIFLVPYIFGTCLISEVFFFQLQLLLLKTIPASYPCLFLLLTRLFFKTQTALQSDSIGCVQWLLRLRKSELAASGSGNISLSVARLLEITSLLLSRKRTLGYSPARSDTALKITLFFFLVVPVKAINN